MKYLVTGASGFFGANLVREIASRGLPVVATTMRSPAQAVLGFLEEYEPVIEWRLVDVR